MALVNDRLREIQCKIAYYGPAASGKTSNLTQIHRHAPVDARGDILTLTATVDPRPSRLLPLALGVIAGYQVRLHLYTVPGSTVGDAGRPALLSGADGVVFVVDSEQERFRDNLSSLHELVRTMEMCRAGKGSIPVVVQYNKRDVPGAVPVPILNARLNPTTAPSCEAVATSGVGVFATLQTISQLLIERIGHL